MFRSPWSPIANKGSCNKRKGGTDIPLEIHQMYFHSPGLWGSIQGKKETHSERNMWQEICRKKPKRSVAKKREVWRKENNVYRGIIYTIVFHLIDLIDCPGLGDGWEDKQHPHRLTNVPREMLQQGRSLLTDFHPGLPEIKKGACETMGQGQPRRPRGSLEWINLWAEVVGRKKERNLWQVFSHQSLVLSPWWASPMPHIPGWITVIIHPCCVFTELKGGIWPKHRKSLKTYIWPKMHPKCSAALQLSLSTGF